jgi:hypothetical protein
VFFLTLDFESHKNRPCVNFFSGIRLDINEELALFFKNNDLLLWYVTELKKDLPQASVEYGRSGSRGWISIKLKEFKFQLFFVPGEKSLDVDTAEIIREGTPQSRGVLERTG